MSKEKCVCVWTKHHPHHPLTVMSVYRDLPYIRLYSCRMSRRSTSLRDTMIRIRVRSLVPAPYENEHTGCKSTQSCTINGQNSSFFQYHAIAWHKYTYGAKHKYVSCKSCSGKGEEGGWWRNLTVLGPFRIHCALIPNYVLIPRSCVFTLST